MPVVSGSTQSHVIRLQPGDELKSSLLKAVRNLGVTSAWIQTAVGSLTSAEIRLANADKDHPNEIITLRERTEILSLVGTIDGEGSACHLHISLGDKTGNVKGGHVVGGCSIFTTAEIVLGTSKDIRFCRVMDATTGYPELLPELVDRIDCFKLGWLGIKCVTALVLFDLGRRLLARHT